MRKFLPSLIFILLLSHYVSAVPKAVSNKIISLNGVNLSINIIQGSEPAVVFESGSGVDSAQWNKIITALSSKIDNTIVSYDRAGYGNSSLPRQPYKIETEVSWLEQSLAQLGLTEPIIYVGHSYAFYLLQTYQHKYPDSVATVIYVDPITIDFIDAMGGIEQELKHFDPALLPNNKLGKALLRETEAMPNTYEKVKKLKVATDHNCVVISAQSPEWSSKQEVKHWKLGQQKLVKHCNSNIIIAPDSGHDVPSDSPETIIKAIVNMLEK